ncbi:hypothetical protein [Sphingobacterium spiritivorum]|uniref:hypothetical protein n=1 Tax=Sphingobacterium spiritivorum TaxID=258 RepID=UPI003DA64CB0
MNREELIQLARKIQDAIGETEGKNDELPEIFLNNISDLHAANYFLIQRMTILLPKK